MLFTFFFTVREAGVKAALSEFLMLLEALSKHVAIFSLDDFYHLSRAALVKDESQYDRFDRAFAAYFKGVEAITGELPPGAEVGAWATQRPDGSWLLDGVMPVSELKARLDIKQLPEEERSRYNTLAGLLQSAAGRLPGVGECVDCAGWRFEVLDLDGKRIDKVLASRQTSEAAS